MSQFWKGFVYGVLTIIAISWIYEWVMVNP